MATVTFLALLDQLLDEIAALNLEEGALGYKVTANVGTTSLTTTDAEIIKMGSATPATRFQGWFGYASDNAELRPLGTIAVAGGTATIQNAGANYTADSSSTFYILRVDLTRIRALANDALEYIPIECIIPLMHGPTDGHMQDSDATAFTTSNVTAAKQTTAAEVLWGARSLSLTDTAGGGTATTGTMKVEQGGQITAFSMLKADTGTWTLRFLDNGANTLDQDITVTEEDWMIARKVLNLETDDEGVAARLIGTATNDQCDVQSLWFVKSNNRHFQLPTWLDDRFKLKAVSVGVLGQASRNTDLYLAADMRFKTLRDSHDYRLSQRYGDANPTWLEVINGPLYDPMFLHVMCPASAPYGVSATFSTDASTTTVPAHVMTAYMKKLIGERYGKFVPAWKQLEALGEREYRERWTTRRTERPQPVLWQGSSGGVCI